MVKNADVLTASEPIQPKIEEIVDTDDSDDETTAADAAAPTGDVAPAGHKMTRGEKKVRKAVEKMGMKLVKGVMRVVIKRPKNMLFTFSRPDVYKSADAATFLVFGEARMEDTSHMQQAAAAAAMAGVTGGAPSGATSAASKPVAAAAAAAADEEEVDDSNIEAKDIELVMSQANVSRAAAIKAIRENNGDMINAIMSLSM